MKLTILGSGTSVFHPKRSSSGYWLETPGGTILLDCAASVPHRMAQEGLNWGELDAIWISHFHLDHFAGLPAFLFGTKHAPETQGRTKTLTIFGPKGLKDLLQKVSDAGEYKLFEQPFPLEIREVEPLENIEIVGLHATAMKTPHTEASLGLHLRSADDKTFVFTADTGFTDVIASFARRVDLLLIECSFVADKPTDIHIQLDEAMFLIGKAEPRRAVLTHLYPEWDEVDFAEQIKNHSPRCAIIEASDGLVIEV
ncbi:MAG: ribonuclease Z [Blastocatellia bacterium]|nr:ribonuclease Z [Blastocatellia bacterium]